MPLPPAAVPKNYFRKRTQKVIFLFWVLVCVCPEESFSSPLWMNERAILLPPYFAMMPTHPSHEKQVCFSRRIIEGRIQWALQQHGHPMSGRGGPLG